ncbi:MAG: 3'-5' exonuclease, partial [Oscillospiraceae bacterium]
IDNYDQSADSVTLMTIHSAKGLEFPYVFLVGVEEGIFPGEMSRYNPEDIEEERRLCYVGITRAKKVLYISHCNERMIFGQTKRPQPSRFVEEIDKSVCEIINKNQRIALSSNTQSGGLYPNGGTSTHTRSGGISFNAGTIAARPSAQGTTIKKPIAKVQFEVGDKVAHKVFGNGTVQKITPLANDAMLEILFDSVGIKKVMANFTPIVKID